MFRGGQPYTDFRNINCKDGRLRLEGKPFGTVIRVNPTTLSADRTVYLANASGSMFIKGYHVIFGSMQVTGNANTTMSLVPVGAFMTASVPLSGIKTTSFVFANTYSTAGAGAAIAVAGANCKTANYLQLQLTNVTAGTVAQGSFYINYVVMHPQTS